MMVRRKLESATARATNELTNVFGLPIATGKPSTTVLPTRLRVASTQSSGAVKRNGADGFIGAAIIELAKPAKSGAS